MIRYFNTIVVLWVCSTISTGVALETMRAVAAQVRHSNAVLEASNKVLQGLTDAETGQRGYLLTQDRTYLDDYESGRENTIVAVTRLEKLVEGDPVHSFAIQTITETTRLKLSEVADTIQLRDRSFDEALEMVNTDTGQRLMKTFRAAQKKIVEDEGGLRLERLDQYYFAWGVAKASSFGSVLFTALALVFRAYIYYWRR